MYEVDFSGWIRTPEAIKELKENQWKRRKFHWMRVIKTIECRKWRSLKYVIINFLTNNKNL